MKKITTFTVAAALMFSAGLASAATVTGGQIDFYVGITGFTPTFTDYITGGTDDGMGVIEFDYTSHQDISALNASADVTGFSVLDLNNNTFFTTITSCQDDSNGAICSSVPLNVPDNGVDSLTVTAESYGYSIDTVDVSGGVTTTGHGTILVSPVPVPAAAWLFGSAVLGLVGVNRRKLTRSNNTAG